MGLSGQPRHITYLLGAGASRNALPLNNETQEFLRRFSTYMLAKPVGNERAHMSQLDLYPDILRLIDEFPRYGSYDKMAKHLLCRGPEWESTREEPRRKAALQGGEPSSSWKIDANVTTTLARLKVLLATYYFFEQFRDKSKDNYSLSLLPDQPVEGVQALRNLDAVDSRVESLIRNCLEIGQGVMADGVWLLTWNYDLQLELAYAKVKGLSDVYQVMSHHHLGVHPGRKQDRHQRVPRVVHLNGVAGLLYNLEDASTRLMEYGDAPNTLGIEELQVRNWGTIFSMSQANLQWSHHETFSFAWEDHWPSRMTQIYLPMQGLWTNVLVLFGYSRPELNARVDHRFLSTFLLTEPHHDKKIILCGKGADGEALRTSWGVPTSIEIVVDEDISRIPTPEEIRSRYGPNPTFSSGMST